MFRKQAYIRVADLSGVMADLQKITCKSIAKKDKVLPVTERERARERDSQKKREREREREMKGNMGWLR